MNLNDLPVVSGAPPDYPYFERLLPRYFGVNRDELRALRNAHLRETVHYTTHKKRIWLNSAGAHALFAVMGPGQQKNAPTSPTPNPDVPDPVKKAPPADVKLRIVRADLKNRYLILACPADQDPDRPKDVLRVRVRNHTTGPDMRTNFLRRMEIPARLVTAPDLYELTRPMPRKKGKW